MKLELQKTDYKQFPDDYFKEKGTILEPNRIIEIVITGNSTALQITDSIAVFTNLRRLVLSNNQISTINPLIGQLGQIRVLDLSENQIDNIPPAVFKLTYLEELSLHTNRINEIPAGIKNLTCTKRIDLSYNNIKSIPDEIFDLSDIEELLFSGNSISLISDEIEKLRNLKALSLNNNQIAILPNTLGKLSFLKKLVLSNNFLSSLPISIGELQNLKTLYIDNNPITVLPHSILNIRNIEKIDIQNTPLFENLNIEKRFETIGAYALIQNIIKSQTLNLDTVDFKTVKLKMLKIINIGHFEHFVVKFDDTINGFVGENGTGKTTILKAIAVAIIGDKYLNFKEFASTMLRITMADDNRVVYQTGKIKLDYSIDNRNYYNEITITPVDDGRDFVVEFNGNFKLMMDNYHIAHLIIGFPQVRETNIDKPVIGKTPPNKPHISDIEPLIDNEDKIRLKSFAAWITNLYVTAIKKEAAKNINFIPNERELLDKIFQLISYFTNDCIKFLTVRDASTSEVWITTNDAPNGVPLNLISQGYKILISWLGFFMNRLKEVYSDMPFLNALKQPAIFLIDEIDTSIHPVWQAEMVKLLKDTFPKTQFIFTTHSPLSVYGLQKEQIIKLQLQNNAIVSIVQETDNWAWKYEELLAFTFNTEFRLLKPFTIPQLETRIAEISTIENPTQEQVSELQFNKLALKRLKESKAATSEIEKRNLSLDQREKELDELHNELLEWEKELTNRKQKL